MDPHIITIFNVSILGIIEPVPVGQASKDYLSRKVNPTLLKGLTELCKQKPLDPVVSNVFLQR